MKNLLMFLAAMGMILAGSTAAMAAITVTQYTTGAATTSWTTTTAAVGSYSLELFNPGNQNTLAGVLVTNLGDPKVKDFAGWDYWTRGPQFHGANFRMWLDTPYDNYPGEDWDVAFNVMPYNTLFYEGGDSAQPIPGDTWVNIDSATRYPYQFFAWDGTGTYLGGHDIATQSNAITWNEFQALDPIFAHVDWGTWDYTYDFSEAIIRKISIRMGGGGHFDDQTGYLDDFTLNGVPIQVENGFTVIPEPASIIVWSLLAAVGITVGWSRRRRKA